MTGLYDRAHAALADELPILAPVFRERIARMENRAFPDQARADARTGFLAAVALDSNGTQQHWAKQSAEVDAISALIDAGDSADALALVPRSDLPQEILYDQYLILAATDAQAADLAGAIRQCVHQTGVFPYQGAAHVLADARFSDSEAVLLAGQGADAAAQEHDPARFQFATLFLAEAAKATPSAAPKIESAVIALLAAVNDDNSSGADMQRQTGSQLLGLLAQLDASRAQDLRTRYPKFSQPVTPILQSGFLGSRPRMQRRNTPSSRRAAPPNPDQLMDRASGITDPTRKLAALTQAAGVALDQRDPRGADRALDDAVHLWDGPLAASKPDLGLNLASVLARAHRTSQAQAVLGQVLDTAETQLRDLRTQYANGGDADRRQVFNLLSRGDNGPVADLFARAAAVDWSLSARRAAALPAGFGLAMVLATVASRAPTQSP